MYNDRDTMEAPADFGPEYRWGMILRGYLCQTLERRVFVLVLLVAEEVVWEMNLAVTTANLILLEENALALLERHGQMRGAVGKI